MNLGRYTELLRTPGVARPVVFALMGRLPFGVLPLSILLLMRREHYDYGEIGAVLGAEALAVGLTAVFVGRLVDRVGQTPVLLTTAAITAVAIVAEAVAIVSGAPLPVLVIVGAIQGASVPPVSASMRTLWSGLVREDRLDAAYAFDSVALELVFIVGPLIAAGLATAWTPLAGMLLCAALYSGAAVGFALTPASRAWAPVEPGERTRAGALRSAGLRTLVLSGAVAAISFGVLEVAIAAFAEDEGAGLLGLGAVPLPFADSLVAMGAVLFLTGLALAPLGATEYALIGALAPEGTVTEAYSWQIVANVTGSAAGAFLAGVLIEYASVDWALGSASIACGLGLLVALAGRRTLSPVAA